MSLDVELEVYLTSVFLRILVAQSAGAVEYTDSFFAEG